MGNIKSICCCEDEQKQINDLNKQLKNVKNQLEQEKQKCSKKAKELEHCNSVLKVNNQKLNKDYFNLQNGSNKKIKQLQSQLFPMEGLKKQIKRLQIQLSQKQERINRLQKQLSQLNKKYAALNADKQKQMTFIILKNKEIEGELTKKQKENFELQTKINSKDQQIKRMKDQKDYNMNNKNIVPAKDNDLGERNNYFKYFQGDVLDQADDYRDFLVTILENKIHKTIQKTKLVYKYDPHSQESIHKYIDNIENIVLLVKTTNGYIFGGWTESAFIPKTSSTKSGLLFSVTNRACFELVTPNTKAIVHDPYFVIFGNNQIRLKNGDIKVTSNFGKINGFYKSKGERANILLGNGSLNEADIETFEFFSLTFRN